MHHDEWFDEIINNLKNNPYKIDSAELFKKQDGFSLKESITYNYLDCYLLFYSLKKTNTLSAYFKTQ